jgi:acylglycerol lipase
MKTFESSWANKQGLRFYSMGWEPDSKPKAVVALLPGLGDHTGRFAHVGEAFSNAGYALVGVDLRGNGKSGGQRGHTPSIEAYMQDIDLLLEHVHARYPGVSTFVYGHSLGAILALNYAIRRRPDLQGVIVTAPALHSDLENQRIKVRMAKVLGGLIPTVALPSGLKTNMLSHDPQVERTYRSDPAVHDRITFGWGKTMLEVTQWTLEHASEFPLPLLLMHGALDTIAYPSSSREIAAAVGDQATLVLWENMYHEIHNELRKEEVLETAIRWMGEHLQ